MQPMSPGATDVEVISRLHAVDRALGDLAYGKIAKMQIAAPMNACASICTAAHGVRVVCILGSHLFP
jgi:hypothetical protein